MYCIIDVREVLQSGLIFFFFFCLFFCFFFNDTATTEIYTLSLHDALPISLAKEKKDIGMHDGSSKNNENMSRLNFFIVDIVHRYL